MADYNIDRLSIEIQTQATQAETSIDRLITKISVLRGQFEGLRTTISSLGGATSMMSGLTSTAENVSNSFGKVRSSIQSVATTKLSTNMNEFATAARDATATTTSGLSTSSTHATRLTARITKTTSEMEKLKTETDKEVTSATRLGTVLKGIGIGAIWQLGKRIGSIIGGWVTASNDFVENKNLFDVEMQGFNEEANEFINKLQDVLGVDPSEAMRYLGFMQQLTSGLGVASDKTYTMSKNLTQLGYDISSFFNMPIEDAMLKIQSGIAGEIEPLRRVGYALTEATLQQTLYEHGINRKIRTLTDAEKAELRYVALMEKSVLAQGDMARTLNSPANQMRILKQNIIQCARALGNMFLPMLQIVIPWLTAFFQIIRDIANFIAKLFGFEMPEFKYDFEDASTGVSDMTDGIEDANSGLDETKKKVKDLYAPFDELNVLKEPDTSTGSGGSGGASAGAGGGGLFDKDFLESLGYDMFADAVSQNLDKIKKKIEALLPIIAAVAGGFLAWKISDAFQNSIVALGKKLKKLEGKNGKNPFSKWKLPTFIVTGVDKLGKKIKGFVKNPFKSWKIAAGVAGVLLVMVTRTKELWQNSTKFRKGLKRIKDIVDLLADKYDEMKGAFDKVFVEPLKAIWNDFVENLPDGIQKAVEKIGEWLDKLDADFGDVALTAAGIVALFIPGGQPIGLALLGFEALSLGIRGLGSTSDETWNDMLDGAEKTLTEENFIKVFKGIKTAFETIMGFIVNPVNTWNKIKESAAEYVLSDDFGTKGGGGVFGVIYNGFALIISFIADPINTWNKIRDSAEKNIKKNDYGSDAGGVFHKIFDAFILILGFITNPNKTWNLIKESALNYIKSDDFGTKKGGGVFGRILDGFMLIINLLLNPKETWEAIKAKAREKNTKTIWEKIWDPIASAFETPIKKIKNKFDTLITNIKKTIKELFDDNEPVTNVGGVGGTTKSSGKSTSKKAAGGFPSMGELFIARESGAELVGSIGSQTAVANNDQIVRSVAIGVANAVASTLGSMGGNQNITVTTLLDGEVVYKNQQKVAKRRGATFNMGAFAR